jgi:hypothetical protein
MLLAIAVTFLLVATLGYGLRGGRRGELIVRHPYNNRYNDASAAREDNLDLNG